MPGADASEKRSTVLGTRTRGPAAAERLGRRMSPKRPLTESQRVARTVAKPRISVFLNRYAL